MSAVKTVVNSWQPMTPADARPALEGGDVDLWMVSFAQLEAKLQQFLALLSDDERTRAARFKFDRDRKHYILGRGFLRWILSSYCQTSPDSLEFHYSDYGKPFLKTAAEICFNVSHSVDRYLLGVQGEVEIGVDIEAHRADMADTAVAERFFAAEEYRGIARYSGAAYQQAFFRTWTRKEAFIKARGEGLALPLDQFVVNNETDQPSRLLSTAWDPAEAVQWHIYHIEPGIGYTAALASRSEIHRIRQYQYSG